MSSKLTREQKQELHRAVLEGKAEPIALLTEMHKDTSGHMRHWLNHRLMEIIACDMPKMAMVAHQGPTVDRTDEKFSNCQEIFKQSMEFARQQIPDIQSNMSATVEHSGERIGEIIDSCINRIMMEDKLMNREAWLDVVTTHAKLCRALMGITQVPEGADDESDS